MDVETARTLASQQLVGLPRRLAHVEAVALRADWLVGELRLSDSLLTSAAWLHDIGYGSSSAVGDLHSLDGARFLRSKGVDPRLTNLVAHHSYARREAEERGVADALSSEFPLDESLPHEFLCYCDMTTGPDGQRMDVVERLAEIRERYGPDDVVTRFITRAEPEIVATVRQVEQQLATQSR